MQQLVLLALLGLLARALAECPNGCSSHGKCGAYDMCTCYRNWMAADCSERICQFGLAHVDTPKGDLDASSGALTGPDKTVVYNDAVYPSGTTEQFPSMYDTKGNVVPNTAHEYRECSNKGICDRSSGSCQCFAGYEGSACQRASCPVTNGMTCSGHGKCKDIKTLAQEEDNVYNLWDEYSTLGCQCDAGFTGADCSQKHCKKGADPLYYDDFANVRFANWTVQFYTQSSTEYVYGNYSFVFTDSNGEDWQTDPIDINANCNAVTMAFESLPNNVVPEGTVLCFKSELPLHNKQAYLNDGSTSDSNTGQQGPASTGIDAIYDSNFFIVNRLTLAFPANPGKLAPLKVNAYLDGSRPTLYTKAYPSTLGWHIFPNGYTGEDTDYVNDECVGVLASVNVGTTTHYLGSLSTSETALLKACLGDSNGVSSDNVDTYNWDYGNWMNPHLIKLVEATGDRVTQYLRPDGTSYTIADNFMPKGEGVDGKYGDTQTYDYPITRLCNNGRVWVTRKNNVYLPVSTSEVNSDPTIGESAIKNLLTDTSNFYDIGQQGYCVNVEPPGFYAVIYYDDCSNQPTMNSRGYPNPDPYTTPYSFCDAANPFRILTRAGSDYGTTTLFHIYTTKGWLQLVNENVGAYTTDASPSQRAGQKVASYHSDTVHFTNVTENYKIAGTTVQTFWGQLDCETTVLGKQGALDCIDKDSMVMFLSLGIKDPKDALTSGASMDTATSGLTFLDGLYNTVANPDLLKSYNLKGSNQVTLSQGKCFEGVTSSGVTYGLTNVAPVGTSSRVLCPDSGAYLPTAASLASNPKYPNIYTVRSIGRNPKDFALLNGGNAGRVDPSESWFPDSDAMDEAFRLTAMLDYALNANYPKTNIYNAQQALGVSVATPAAVFKFYPPPAGGYNYVGECSNRGLCNSGTGVCSCFAGYTGDNCGEVNALAV